MFLRRSREFDPRISAIAGHLRAIEKELGGIGNSAGRRASASATAAVNQIADAIGPILKEIEDRFRFLGWDARRPDARQNTRLVFLKSV